MQKIFAACGARKLCGGIRDAGLGRSLRPVQPVELACKLVARNRSALA
jgi:hypothetical protein